MGTSGSSEFVVALVEEYLQRRRQGESPTVDEYVARCPDREEEIRGLLRTMAVVEQVKGDLDSTADTASVNLNGKPCSQLGDFRIIREVGRGAMGIVYEAEQVTLGRHVALKVMSDSPHMTQRHLDRFLQESRAAARLHHTNIVPVFGVGEQEGLHYYVMQFIPGQSLEQVLGDLKLLVRKDGSLDELALADSASSFVKSLIHTGISPVYSSGLGPESGVSRIHPRLGSPTGSEVRQNVGRNSGMLPSFTHSKSPKLTREYFHSVASIGMQVADALAYAHANNTLHRDIKPSNLILDSKGTIWVTDFGLAKISEDSDLTEKGDIVGTLLYMAPERFRGASDPRCDICSLGLTLYELLALRPAFDAASRTQLIHQISAGIVQPLRKWRPEVPRDLETVVMKAVDSDPDCRYQTAYEMAEDLRNVLKDRPINARRTAPVERAWRWCRRNPLVANLVSLVALLMCAITIGSIYSVHRLQREQQARVQDLAEKLVTAPPNSFGFVFEELRSRRDIDWRERALASVEQIFASEPAARDLKRRSAMVLTLLGRPQVDFLINSALTAPASEYANLALALRAAGTTAVSKLRELAASEPELTVKARLAVLLLGLGDASAAEEMLAAREDPAPRADFIHEFASYGILTELPEILENHPAPAFQSGLCASMGGIEPNEVPPELRGRLIAILLRLYRTSPSAATHSAAGWVLTRWQTPLPVLEPGAEDHPEREWFVNGAGMTMLRVPSGFTSLGDTRSDELQTVYLSRPYFLCDREVTLSEFEKFLADQTYPIELKPRDWPGSDSKGNSDAALPLHNVTTFDALLFANWLSTKEARQPCYVALGQGIWRCDFQANGYRLPTEAEWEHACRGGSKTYFFTGDRSDRLSEYASIDIERVRPGAQLRPNAFGFYDMISNVGERCWDIHHDPYSGDSTAKTLAIDPLGPSDRIGPASKTTLRGGSVSSSSTDFRSGRRLDLLASWRGSEIGFRLACYDDAVPPEKIAAALRSVNDSREDAWRALQRWYSEGGRLQEGEAALARLLAETPHDGRLAVEYGFLLSGLCRLEDAAAAWRHAGEDLRGGGRGLFEGSWWLSGPYPEDLRTSCPPETDAGPCEGSAAALWRPVVLSDGNLLRFDAYLDNTEHISAYAWTQVYSTSNREATLLVGSDDQLRVWINDELVQDNPAYRMAVPDDDEVPIRLRAGWNKVLVKVTNSTGGHFLYLRWSTDPVRLARAHLRLGRGEAAEAALAAERRRIGQDSPRLRREHARLLAGALRFAEAQALFEQSSGAGAARGPAAGDWLLSNWWVLGAFPRNHAPPPSLLTDADPTRPLELNGSVLRWRTAEGEHGGDLLSLKRIFGSNYVTSYALTHVYSSTAQEVTLLLSADKKARIWLNGELVDEYPKAVYAVRATERADIQLRAGWNRILVRVESGERDNLLSLRISSDPDERAKGFRSDYSLVRQLPEAIKDNNARPNDPQVQMRMGGLLAELEEWQLAASHFQQGLKNRAPYRTRRLLLLTLLAIGDRPAAEAAASDLLLTSPVSEAGWVDLPEALLSCVVSPDLNLRRELLKQLAEKAVKRNAADPFCWMAKGATLYRSGDFQEALQCLLQSVEGMKEGIPFAYSCFFLAMTQSHLETKDSGSPGCSAAWLEKAIRASEDLLQRADSRTAVQRKLNWEDRLSLRLLRREAESLLPLRKSTGDRSTAEGGN